MADMFKYPVFFECSSLQLKHKRKIEDYFQIKRRSDRGDCGHLRRINNNIYSVAFKDKKDQQAVLQKSKHDVDGLVFTVRDSLKGSHTSVTTSLESQDLTAPVPPSPPEEEYKHTFVSTLSVHLRVTDKCVNVSQNLIKGTREAGSNSLHDNLQVHKDEITGQRSVTLVNNSHGDLGTTCPENLNARKVLHGAGAGYGRENTTNMDGGATVAPEDCVPVEIIQGTLETQKADALVAPMVGHDPYSTRVGITLSNIVEPRLKVRFGNKTRKAKMPGDVVMMDGFSQSHFPFNAIFFLNLAPYDGDRNGGAAEVLRLGISSILDACEKRGFTSVAFPVLGAGAALNFPSSIVARILLEEVEKFKQHQGCGTPLQVKIVIHPKDKESYKNFRSELKAFQSQRDMKPVSELSLESTPKRIVLLGKTGSGKSSLANTVFGEKLFIPAHNANSGTSQCQAETRRNITLIDTPGLFDTERSEKELKPEIVRCLTECAPGPHAFLIVLKVERFTEQEEAVVTKICQYFSEDALKYTVIVFTHGDQLLPGKKIKEFVSENKKLSDLVKKCGGRCHVIDNKYWENNEEDDYRDNCLQVKKLLDTIDKMVMENNGDFYTNEMLQVTEREIQNKVKHIQQTCGDLTEEEINTQAKAEVHNKFLVRLAGVATGAVVGAFFGLAAAVGVVITALQYTVLVRRETGVGVGARATRLLAGGVAAGGTIIGGVMGGVAGYHAVQEAETVMEAAEKAADEVNKGGQAVFNSNKPLLPRWGQHNNMN